VNIAAVSLDELRRYRMLVPANVAVKQDHVFRWVAIQHPPRTRLAINSAAKSDYVFYGHSSNLLNVVAFRDHGRRGRVASNQDRREAVIPRERDDLRRRGQQVGEALPRQRCENGDGVHDAIQ